MPLPIPNRFRLECADVSKRPASIAGPRCSSFFATPFCGISNLNERFFVLLDTDGLGVIDPKELKVDRCALSFEPKKEAIRKITQDVDDDGSGTVDYDEIPKEMTQQILSLDPKVAILKAFCLFDDDETGKISLKNLMHVAIKLDESKTDEELQVMINEADRDRDGEMKRSNSYT